MLTDLKGEIYGNIIIVEDFKTPFSSRQKINKETMDLNSIIDQMDLADIHRTLQTVAAKYTFF